MALLRVASCLGISSSMKGELGIKIKFLSFLLYLFLASSISKIQREEVLIKKPHKHLFMRQFFVDQPGLEPGTSRL